MAAPTSTDKRLKHTPGPWFIVSRPGEYEDAFWIGPEPFHSIATVRNGANDDEYGGNERREANANLIASAPDLLAALQNVNALVSEAAMTGFNWKDGDWAERLFYSQQQTSRAIRLALTGER